MDKMKMKQNNLGEGLKLSNEVPCERCGIPYFRSHGRQKYCTDCQGKYYPIRDRGKFAYQTSISFTDEQKRYLYKLAGEQNISISQVVREMVEEDMRVEIEVEEI